MSHILEQIEGVPDQVFNSKELRDRSMTNLEEFQKSLLPYTAVDYQGLDGPYDRLVEAAHFQNNLFDQLAIILCRDAVSKGCSKAQVEESITAIKQIYLYGIIESKTILELIDKVEADYATAEKVSVLPLMCGSGKSNAVTLKIREVLEKHDGSGMIVVTDSIERLKKYWNPEPDNREINAETRQFIDKNKGSVVELVRESYIEDIRKQKAAPVLLMTTQRYFRLTKKEILSFLRWGDNGRRNLIVFDEQPYLNTVSEITAATINNIDSALRLAIDDTADQAEKRWCIEQWDRFRTSILEVLMKAEYESGVSVMYCQHETHAMTEDDERFMAFIEHHCLPLRSYPNNAYAQIQAVRQFVQTWGLYVYRAKDTGAYESKLMVYIDNRDKVTGFDAKVIVLDGTGDINPIYTGQDYIDLRGGEDYSRSLSKLTIRLGDIKTGQEDFSEYKGWTAKAITKYLLDHESKDDVVIFTYKNTEEVFKKEFSGKNQVAHFNNIKGLNKYSKVPCIAQAGLNRYQTGYYLTYMIAREDEFRATLQGLQAEEQKAAIESKLKETNNCAAIMLPQILSDIEQNMFRSSIRHINNQQHVRYYLFFNRSSYPGLDELIRSRYHDRFGACIEYVSYDEIAAGMKSEEATVSQKLKEWYKTWDGEPIKRQSILEKIGVSEVSFKAAINRHKDLKDYFEAAKKAAKEKGYSRGYYSK